MLKENSSNTMLVFRLILLQLFYLSVNCVDVKTSSGTVRGLTVTALNKTVKQFLNIPFAEPPVRFARPVPKKTVQVIIDGTEVGNSCYQNEKNANGGLVPLVESEDCLALNVWSPAIVNASQPLPVMFWIYGGSFTSGSIAMITYNGSQLAAHDVVVVSANYRLGMFGWLYIDDNHSNAGLYDQLLALQWVRQNIHAFGGDPNQITVFGESAGSMSVSAHVLSLHSRGLFKKAILESGALFWNKDKPILSRDQAKNCTQEMAKHFNCSGDQWLRCLRRVDAKELSQYYDCHFYPIFGTDYLPLSAQQSFASHNYSKDIDIMAGVMRNEGSLLAHMSYPESDNITNADQFGEVLRTVREQGLNAKDIKQFYLKNVNKSNVTAVRLAFYDFYGDLHMNCPTYLFTKRFAEESTAKKAFFYWWTHSARLLGPAMGCTEEMGVCHAADIEYVFGLSVIFGMPDKKFSVDIMRVWTNFAKNREPFDGFTKNKEWPRLLANDSRSTNIRELNQDSFRIYHNLFEKTCDGFWKDYFL